MKDDELIDRIRRRAVETTTLRPVALLAEVEAAEARLGTRLPAFHRRLLLGVANGGLGPGFGLFGVPPGGAFDRDLPASDFIDLHESQRREGEAPRGVVYLCSWGGGRWSHLDVEDPEGAVLTSEWLAASHHGPAGLAYWRTSSSLREWLREWVDAADPRADLTVDVLGWELRTNPFTGDPKRYPVTEPRGQRLDLTHRR